jgi:hypothetical protein
MTTRSRVFSLRLPHVVYPARLVRLTGRGSQDRGEARDRLEHPRWHHPERGRCERSGSSAALHNDAGRSIVVDLDWAFRHEPCQGEDVLLPTRDGLSARYGSSVERARALTNCQ